MDFWVLADVWTLTFHVKHPDLLPLPTLSFVEDEEEKFCALWLPNLTWSQSQSGGSVWLAAASLLSHWSVASLVGNLITIRATSSTGWTQTQVILSSIFLLPTLSLMLCVWFTLDCAVSGNRSWVCHHHTCKVQSVGVLGRVELHHAALVPAVALLNLSTGHRARRTGVHLTGQGRNISKSLFGELVVIGQNKLTQKWKQFRFFIIQLSNQKGKHQFVPAAFICLYAIIKSNSSYFGHFQIQSPTLSAINVNNY